VAAASPPVTGIAAARAAAGAYAPSYHLVNVISHYSDTKVLLQDALGVSIDEH
jgi:hypothetical protein